MKITEMANDIFLVHLRSPEDYRHTIFEGPWKVADHYMIVHRWRLFVSLNANITRKVAVWDKIPKLPIELGNDQFLRRIGSALGTMLKVDKLIFLHGRGKFVRICVELDLDKPLSSHIMIWVGNFT